VLTGKDFAAVAERAKAAAVPLTQIGATGGRVLAVADERPLVVSELRSRFENWLPDYMAAPA
jgi:phosphoribosylformylglycinamidine synthase